MFARKLPMKKYDFSKLLAPRQITLQNSKQSFADFIRVVQSVLDGTRVFVSNQIFAEVWDNTVQNGGKITPPVAKNDFLVYSFSSGQEKANLKMVFYVYPDGKPNQKIELVLAKGFRLNFAGGYLGGKEKFYLQRAPEKNQDFEK